VHERGRLQGVTGGLSAHEALCLLVQLAVDQREQLVECAPVALAPGPEQLGHMVGERRRHSRTRRFGALGRPGCLIRDDTGPGLGGQEAGRLAE